MRSPSARSHRQRCQPGLGRRPHGRRSRRDDHQYDAVTSQQEGDHVVSPPDRTGHWDTVQRHRNGHPEPMTDTPDSELRARNQATSQGVDDFIDPDGGRSKGCQHDTLTTYPHHTPASPHAQTRQQHPRVLPIGRKRQVARTERENHQVNQGTHTHGRQTTAHTSTRPASLLATSTASVPSG